MLWLHPTGKSQVEWSHSGSSAPGALCCAARAVPALSAGTTLASVPAGNAGPGGAIAAQAPKDGTGSQSPDGWAEQGKGVRNGQSMVMLQF